MGICRHDVAHAPVRAEAVQPQAHDQVRHLKGVFPSEKLAPDIIAAVKTYVPDDAGPACRFPPRRGSAPLSADVGTLHATFGGDDLSIP